jgi:hypothetical protein
MDQPPKAPTGLRASGKALWAAVVGKYVLTAGELEVLRQAVRTADEVDRLERAVRALPDFVTIGSTGQPRAHPLLSEVRAHRQLLERLCGSLNLPDDDQAVGLRGSSRHAQKAARGRWDDSRVQVPSKDAS